MDDPTTEPTPRLATAQRDAAIRAALSARKHQAALFVCGMRVDSPEGKTLLDAWEREGHILGNHTWSHPYLHSKKRTLAEFLADAEKGEAVVRGRARYRKLFRYPFLKEGDTAEKRDGVRAWLDARGCRVGHVTIDASDWYFDQRLRKRLEREPQADLAPYRDAYVAHLLDRAGYYDGLARALLGRAVPHTMLVHHSLLNALFLGEVLDAFVKKGWALVSAEEAFADPLFATRTTALPAGESLIWALAKQSGRYEGQLRYPGEDGDYEQAACDKLGL
jgi:peptidoglycan/xylan/chitin deacetylase (PgdA/CDA1 family)